MKNLRISNTLSRARREVGYSNNLPAIKSRGIQQDDNLRLFGVPVSRLLVATKKC